MSEQRINAVKTAPQMKDYAIAALAASEPLLGDFLTKEQIGVLWSQYFTETSAQNCYNWNIGNVKKVTGDGFDYHCLVGTWECYPVAEAQRLLQTGQATLSTKPDHIQTAGTGRLAVVFQPPHPYTRFRAYPSLSAAMSHHLQLLQKRFAKAWPAILAGDPDGAAHGLKLQGYYTASEAAYAGAMDNAFKHWMEASEFEAAEAVVLAVDNPGIVDFGEPLSDDFIAAQGTMGQPDVYAMG